MTPDSDGILPGPSDDSFPYGRAAAWGVHPGRSSNEGTAVDRHVIMRYTVTNAGSYAIVDSMIVDRGCTSGGVDLTVLRNNDVVATLAHTGTTPSGFDHDLGPLIAGDTIDVAVGPGDYDYCDALDIDFSLAYEPAEPGVTTATFSDDFAGPTPTSGWSYWWNAGGPVGDSSQYAPLQWNTIQYDSDGQLGSQSGDEFTFGLVAGWGVHPGYGAPQNAADERYAIVRYTVSSSGMFAITNASINDRGCISGGVELQVRVNDTLVSSLTHSGTTPSPFDTSLGTLAPGDTIDVAVGPDGLND